VAEGQPVTRQLLPFDLTAGVETAIGAVSKPKARKMSANSQTARIRDLNDAFRSTLAEGKCAVSAGVSELGVPFATAAAAVARDYQEFTPDNDPDGEHDFGTFTVDDQRLIWKIDYYDQTLRYGSRDPSNAAETKRVLTVMLAEEY
jgi:hypothetical protein